MLRWNRVLLLVTLRLFEIRAQSIIGYSDDFRLVSGTNTNLGEALRFLSEYDSEASDMCFRVTSAQWAYATNITDFNKRHMNEQQMLKAKFDKVTWRKAIEFDWSRISDPMVRRQIRMLVTGDRTCLPEEKYNEIYYLISEMKDIYAHIRICPFQNDFDSNGAIYCDLELRDVQQIMTTSRNPLELKHIWSEWHNRVGPQMKNKFMRYVELANQAAKLNGFSDAGESLRSVYEVDDFESEISECFHKILPLYKELFAYVRRKLFQKYGPKVLRTDGPIPAHILGNLWAQDWSALYDIVVPFGKVSEFDVTNEMLRQGFTPLRIFQTAEEFYTSLGLEPMPPEFWRFSMLEKPNGRKVQCTASAWDFCNNLDYRIKQCTEVNMDSLITTHHEMAHIQYYLYYSEQPFLYRDGANPGFHEGVANAVSLSVFNPAHLHRIGLLANSTIAYETRMNFLMYMALKKIAYAPFAYLIDQWRYEIFQNGVYNMNALWWDLRLRYQGVTPPIPRTEAHFDAAAKRHIIADVSYVKYFVALLLEFQIHKSMCLAAGYVGPLHLCDVYRSREAGRVLIDVLKVGKARHWKEVIQMLTQGRSNKLSTEPMLEYFEELYRFLKEANQGEQVIGWTTHREDVEKFHSLMYKSNSISVIFNSYVLLLYVIHFAV